jgi:hypothetical protein
VAADKKDNIAVVLTLAFADHLARRAMGPTTSDINTPIETAT